MANNSNRKAIEFMVQGALPPHSTNILWMDTHIPELPVLKIFENGAWTSVHTDNSKAVELLSQTVLQQSQIINDLENSIDTKIEEVAGATEDFYKFFGLPESLPEYVEMTEEEGIAINDENWLALYGYIAVTVTIHYEIDSEDTVSVIYPKYKQLVDGVMQPVTYGQQGFTSLYKLNEGQYVNCLNDVPEEGDIVYFRPNN